MEEQLWELVRQCHAVMMANGAATVRSKMDQAAAKRETVAQVELLNEIVSQLIEDRALMFGVVQGLEEQLQAKRLSADDIEFIASTVLPTLRDLGIEMDDEAAEVVERLLSKDMLNVMQVIGFDYREAIGRPLTQIVRQALLSKFLPDGGVDDETGVD